MNNELLPLNKLALAFFLPLRKRHLNRWCVPLVVPNRLRNLNGPSRQLIVLIPNFLMVHLGQVAANITRGPIINECIRLSLPRLGTRTLINTRLILLLDNIRTVSNVLRYEVTSRRKGIWVTQFANRLSVKGLLLIVTYPTTTMEQPAKYQNHCYACRQTKHNSAWTVVLVVRGHLLIWRCGAAL